MTAASEISEEQLVAKRSDDLQARFKSQRFKSVVLAAFFGIVCLLLMFVGWWIFSVCALFVACICLSNYRAANGHLHHVQRRESQRKKLARDFSKLDHERPSTPEAQPTQTHIVTPTG